MRPPPEQLLTWARGVPGVGEISHDAVLQPVAGDASNRRYFRLHRAGGGSVILVSAPPATEKNREFLAVRFHLADGGLCVPDLLAADVGRGFMALGDLGDQLLLPVLQAAGDAPDYSAALDVLVRLATLAAPAPDWPRYDEALLGEELGRFPEWFVTALLGQAWDDAAERAWTPLRERLLANALAQPTVLVHRDFHSRNLMPQPGGQLAVIDFQDAVVGPISYDMVSLLKDCYIRWPEPQLAGWVAEGFQRLQDAGLLPCVELAQFREWFDLMGLQRHIKVLGTFARLYLRDHKPGYLTDLPRVIGYVRDTLADYAGREPALAAFQSWFDTVLIPAIDGQDWSRR